MIQSVSNRSQQAAQGWSKGMVSGIFSTASAAVGQAADIAVNTMTFAQTLQNMKFQADNLEAAPDQLVNANGNAIFDFIVNDFSLFVEVLAPIESDCVRINDVMHRFGFFVGAIGNVKDYDNIRHYFNYVQANIEEVISDITISMAVRDKFKEAFSNGVRFWNVNNNIVLYDYNPENYENILLEEV